MQFEVHFITEFLSEISCTFQTFGQFTCFEFGQHFGERQPSTAANLSPSGCGGASDPNDDRPSSYKEQTIIIKQLKTISVIYSQKKNNVMQT